MPKIRAVFAADPDAPDDDPGRHGRVGLLDAADLPDGDVTVRVCWSSLNYKDGLALTGMGKVVRTFPMVCGVDLAGVVEESESAAVRPGDEVIVTGWGLGEARHGGFADLARVKSEWVVAVPSGLDMRRAMAIGTAGLTSMLCVLALERHGLRPEESTSSQPVVVTGAAGGVGSVAVAILAKLGYEVAAVSGRPEQSEYLQRLGAASILERSELSDAPPRPLEKEQYAGGVDAVGGTTLATLLRRIRYGGCVAACGLAGGADLVTTVHPFILRGVDLAGVESVRCPNPLRRLAWERLAQDLPLDLLDEMITEVDLADLPQLGQEIVAGRTRGRVVVAVNR